MPCHGLLNASGKCPRTHCTDNTCTHSQTFTMFGVNPEDPMNNNRGLIPRSVEHLYEVNLRSTASFKRQKSSTLPIYFSKQSISRKRDVTEVTIKCSFLEIYKYVFFRPQVWNICLEHIVFAALTVSHLTGPGKIFEISWIRQIRILKFVKWPTEKCTYKTL